MVPIGAIDITAKPMDVRVIKILTARNHFNHDKKHVTQIIKNKILPGLTTNQNILTD